MMANIQYFHGKVNSQKYVEMANQITEKKFKVEVFSKGLQILSCYSYIVVTSIIINNFAGQHY